MKNREVRRLAGGRLLIVLALVVGLPLSRARAADELVQNTSVKGCTA